MQQPAPTLCQLQMQNKRRWSSFLSMLLSKCKRSVEVAQAASYRSAAGKQHHLLSPVRSVHATRQQEQLVSLGISASLMYGYSSTLAQATGLKQMDSLSFWVHIVPHGAPPPLSSESLPHHLGHPGQHLRAPSQAPLLLPFF